jgi:hypothetical protein
MQTWALASPALASPAAWDQPQETMTIKDMAIDFNVEFFIYK